MNQAINLNAEAVFARIKNMGLPNSLTSKSTEPGGTGYVMKIVVYHEHYGCETGCCGHVIEVNGERRGDFIFSHPDSREEFRQFAEDLIAEQFGAEHVKDLDWPYCRIEYD